MTVYAVIGIPFGSRKQHIIGVYDREEDALISMLEHGEHMYSELEIEEVEFYENGSEMDDIEADVGNIAALEKCRAESDSNTAFIWTDEEFLAVDMTDIGELVSAMRFKAEHIRAKADPELFVAVADSLSSVLDTASKAINPVTHGRWSVDAEHLFQRKCTVCGELVEAWAARRYCPYCGANRKKR